MVRLELGDSAEVLKSIESDSIDALVTDPPAGISFMGKEWDHHDTAGLMTKFQEEHKAGGFTGATGKAHSHGTQGTLDRYGSIKARDLFVAGLTPIFRECYRAMKPGAHGLVWALPRTSHWTATALEDAGFEIRDVVMHLFGTGFPKSLDVSKAIDKMKGAEREPTGEVKTRHGGGARSDKVRQLDPDAKETPITLPGSPEAAKFEGWGTALKPAAEHWILVRKPLESTVAENVLRFGTGALNIDASRISTSDNLNGGAYSGGVRPTSMSGCTGEAGGKSSVFEAGGGRLPKGSFKPPPGRFPSHLILDEEAAAALDEQSGDLGKSAGGRIGKKVNGKAGLIGGLAGKFTKGDPGFGDRGGASRFFYVAKAPKADKGHDNHHPTVKNTKLMEYLIRMITPPGGVVLDCFMGSGSTGVAAQALGFDFVGIEREPSYMAIAMERLGLEKSAATPPDPSSPEYASFFD